jgi:hypothetical protein
MRTSQILLLVLMVGFAVYVARLRTAFRDRVIFLVLAAIGAALVLQPEWTNRVAAAFDIGRGADLVIYLFMMAALFVAATLVARIRSLERIMTRLVQDRALERPITAADTAAGSATTPREP